ncbi:MAG: leucyl aminopeptidase [bacterium]|nr:leucyl aminopeptidase [bacterium]
MKIKEFDELKKRKSFIVFSELEKPYTLNYDILKDGFKKAIENGFKPKNYSTWYEEYNGKNLFFVSIDKFDYEPLRRATARVLGLVKNRNIEEIVIITPERYLESVCDGVFYSTYEFTKKFKKTDDVKLKTAFIAVKKPNFKEFEELNVIYDTLKFVMDNVNEAPSEKKEKYLINLAKSIENERVKVNIYNKEKLEKLGMGGILAVNRGSVNPPVLIELIYEPKKYKKTVAFAGKGIVFDSGGLSLKPSDAMMTMKLDLSGALIVLGIFKVLRSLDIPVRVYGYTPFTENMPGNDAYKPGDIIKTYSGKTIEVLNTDAEGRIILSDVLSYACEKKPDIIIDFATLTGAVVVALGNLYAGAMGDSGVIKKLISLSKITGERFWELPLPDDYKKDIESNIADVKNISTHRREAGAIIGGLFLKEFVDEKVKWVHLDIAGTAFFERSFEYYKEGATGFPLRTIIKFLKSL